MSEVPQPPEPAPGPEKKPWSRGKKAGVIGGGCCGVLALTFLGLLILGLVLGPTEEPESPDDPTTIAETEEPAAEDPATEPESDTEPESEPSEEPTEEPSETSSPDTEPSEEPAEEEPSEGEAEPTSEAPAEDDAQIWASSVEETALMGSADWQELCGGDYSLGACWITDVSATNVGTLDVTLQLTGSDPESKELADGAANTIFSTAGFDHEDLQWVVVYGADGVVIKQKQRSDFPYL